MAVVADEENLRAFGCSSAQFFQRTLVLSTPNPATHVDLLLIRPVLLFFPPFSQRKRSLDELTAMDL